MDVQVLFQHVGRVVREIDMNLEYDGIHAPHWVSVETLLESFSSSFMGEHVMAFYCELKNAKFSVSLRFHCRAEIYVELFHKIKKVLEDECDNVHSINPYRFKLPGTPVFFALKDFIKHRNALKSYSEDSLDSRDYLEKFGNEVIIFRRQLLQSIDDHWSAFIEPSWSEPMGLTFVVSVKNQVGVLFEYSSAKDHVECIIDDSVDFNSGIKNSGEKVLSTVTAQPHFVRILKRISFFGNFRSTFSHPLLFAFESYKKRVDAINSKLENPDNCLRALSDDDMRDLCHQIINGHRRLREDFGLGEPQWKTGVEIFICLEREKKTALSMRMDCINWLAVPSTGADRVNVVQDSAVVDDKWKAARSKKEYLVRSESVLDIWMDGLNLYKFIDSKEVSSRILDRDTFGEWKEINRQRNCLKTLISYLRQRIKSGAKVGRNSQELLSDFNLYAKHEPAYTKDELETAINWGIEKSFILSDDPLELDKYVLAAPSNDMLAI